MNDQRWKSVQENDNIKLTADEILQGWHFCCEFDGLLVGPGMGELAYCSCLPVDHVAFSTVPEQLPDPADSIEAGNIREDEGL